MTVFHGFAYGEHRDGPQQRSLGFRLLAPATAHSWSVEVEALARRIHAVPYPESWPATEMFCSVLLETGERLIAVARYGLRDTTPSGRPGALELIGVVGPSDIGTAAARGIYHWLKSHRSTSDDLRAMDREFDLTDISSVVESPYSNDSETVLPIRAWQDGVLLFSAATPGEGDSRLGLLDKAIDKWQWLPLVGGDFPLSEFAIRGPLVAWTPQTSGLVVKVDPPKPIAPARSQPRKSILWPALVLLLIGLTGANLWFTYVLSRKSQPVAAQPAILPAVSHDPPSPVESPERLALAMHRFFQKNGGLRDVSTTQLMANYERLVAQDEDFRATNAEAKLAIGALAHMARRSPSQIEEAARQALDGKGFDPELVQLICRRIHQRMSEGKD